MRVLLADDDALYRHVLRKALESWGYKILTASNGNEALSAPWGVDLPTPAILDWRMSGMDGVERMHVCLPVVPLIRSFADLIGLPKFN